MIEIEPWWVTADWSTELTPRRERLDEKKAPIAPALDTDPLPASPCLFPAIVKHRIISKLETWKSRI